MTGKNQKALLMSGIVFVAGYVFVNNAFAGSPTGFIINLALLVLFLTAVDKMKIVELKKFKTMFQVKLLLALTDSTDSHRFFKLLLLNSYFSEKELLFLKFSDQFQKISLHFVSFCNIFCFSNDPYDWVSIGFSQMHQ
ncbi:MAG: hypothetical protein IPN57_04935 [Ignavibacteria bacterium]|nr:hypothetical protein [Ignavibacteria bacterium]